MINGTDNLIKNNIRALTYIKKCADRFEENAKKIHGDKYDYSLVNYVHSKSKVKIICKIHGIFLQKPNVHLNKRGCNKCGYVSIAKSKTKSTVEFITQANIIHKYKFDYSQVKYENSNKNVRIICKTHGEFLQFPTNHLQGFGCSACSDNLKITQSSFIKKANIVHNEKYNYSLVGHINGNKSFVSIICKKHGVFKKSINKHLIGQGCSQCTSTISKIGTSWLNTLNISTLIPEYKLPENKRRRVDGYDPITNTVYQFHGKYYHSDPRVFKSNEMYELRDITHGQNYQETLVKDFQLLCWGYNLIVMWEYDYINNKGIIS